MSRALRNHAPAVLVYSLGIVSLFFIDLIVARNSTTERALEWSTTRSLMMIVGPLILLGLHNLYIREPQKARITTRLIASILAIISVASSVLVVTYENEWLKLGALSAVIFYALNTAITMLTRSAASNLLAQISQNAWKIVLFIFLCTAFINDKFFIDVSLTSSAALFITTLPIAAYVIKRIPKTSADLTTEDWKFATLLTISSLTVSASTYLEILLVNHFAEDSLAVAYFAHYSLFTASTTFASGYIGFYLTPRLKYHPEIYNAIAKNIYSIVAASIFITAISSILATQFYEEYFRAKHPLQFSWILILSYISIVRIMYIIPTALMGAHGSNDEIFRFVIWGLAAIVPLVLSPLSSNHSGIDVITAIALGSAINWTIRTLAAFHQAKKIIRK